MDAAATVRGIGRPRGTLYQKTPLPHRKRKALEKEVDRRYGSAAALGEDVARHLTAQPILARPASAIYELRKFAARNRALVAGVAASVVLLIAGVVVSTGFGLREAAQRRRAEQARADLEQVADFQTDMLAGVDAWAMGAGMAPDLRQRLLDAAANDDLGDREPARFAAQLAERLRRVNTTDAALEVIGRNFLARAAATVATRFRDRPEIEMRLRDTIVATYDALGLLEVVDTANSLQNLACLDRDRGRYAESRKLFEVVIAIQEKAWGPDHPWSIDNLKDYLQLLRLMGADRAVAEVPARIVKIEGTSPRNEKTAL